MGIDITGMKQGNLFMKKIDWKTRYNRMLIEKETILNSINDQTYSEDRLVNDFESFCFKCFHLFEWIEKVQGTDSARNFSQSNKYIVICGGISNHTKHFIVNRYKNKLYPPNEPYRYATQSIVESSTGYSGQKDEAPAPLQNLNTTISKLTIQVDNSEYTVNEFLQCCTDAWEDYLVKHGLL